MRMTLVEQGTAGAAGIEVVFEGRLDTGGVERIDAAFQAQVVAGGRHALVDMSRVSFVSSMGVRLLLAGARAMHSRRTRLLLAVPPGPVRDLLATAAVDTLVPMYDQLAEARAALQRLAPG